MELISQPAVREEVWTDIDFCFPGEVQTATLKPGDSIVLSPERDRYEVSLQCPNGTIEIVEVFIANLNCKKTRIRRVQIPIKGRPAGPDALEVERLSYPISEA